MLLIIGSVMIAAICPLYCFIFSSTISISFQGAIIVSAKEPGVSPDESGIAIGSFRVPSVYVGLA